MRWWPILAADVCIRNVGTPEQRDALIKEAFLRKQSGAMAIGNSNEGCWRSDFNYKDIAWLETEIKHSLEVMVGHYLDRDLALKSRFDPKGLIMDYWTNINDPRSLNRLHSHSGYDYVGLYFLQGEGTGDLVFHNPANLMNECNLNSPWIHRNAYEPKDGDLLLWPAWMPHEVETNNSNKHRINIAFNIKL